MVNKASHEVYVVFSLISFQAFADALEQVPYTLAENAGLNPIATVTELRSQHANGKKNHGVNVRKVSLFM